MSSKYIDIDYGAFYGVKPGETDFYGAIKRSLTKAVQHLDSKEFINCIVKAKNK